MDTPPPSDAACRGSTPAHTFADLLPLLEHTPVALACWDAQERVLDATPAWCVWFGLPSREEIVGRTLQTLWSAQTYSFHQEYITLAAAGAVAAYQDQAPVSQAPVPSQLIRLIPASEGGAWGAAKVVMVMVNQTRYRTQQSVMQRQQAQIQELQATLQSFERDTAELGRLRTLLDWRTTMLTERNDMLHLLSHEIRQPLTNASAAMQATVKAIADLGLPDASHASRALLRAEHVLQQVIGTLDNTLAAGTLLTVLERASPASDTDLPTLIQLVLHDIAADIRPRIETQWLTETRTVQLHPPLMRLAIRNLLNNALAYSPADAPVVLRVSESDDPLNLIIEIVDQGSGIPEDLLPQLFQKGARGSNSRTRAGAGLGLFIVHSVMQLHRGTVEALPSVPQGCTMRLTAPQGLTD
jgi:two-component system OmpR family sensor kinase